MRFTGERRARRIVARRSGGICEVCDRRAAVEWHHRQNRSQGGGWCPSNGLAVCRRCHDHITVNPTAAAEQGWTVRRAGDPASTRVWLARRGWCLLSKAGDVTPLDRPAWAPQPPTTAYPNPEPRSTRWLEKPN